jgi:hypothetical protein
MGKMVFHFRIIFFIPLQVQSNLDKSSSDNRSLKKNSREIFRSIKLRNDEISTKFAVVDIMWRADGTGC